MSIERLRRVAEDLWETSIDRPFPGLTTHAYLWTAAPAGNVLFYSVATDAQFDELDDLGGVAHQYLSHRDEAGPMLGALARRFGSRLHAPGVEANEIGRHRTPDVQFGTPGRDSNLVEILPTPGHSPGSTCFLVDGADGRYLFTGDTIHPSSEHEWTAGFLPGLSDAAALADSLSALRDLEPDLVILSASTGDAAVQAFSGDEWSRCVDAARRKLVVDSAS